MSTTLYFILGCTASGKGATGREIARRLDTDVISVDSMKVYKRMDIGTAKPPADVRAQIPHHCVDVVEPWESYSVARFVEDADRAVTEIRNAGKIPLAVGGTSLYIKALSEGLFEGPKADPELRRQLEQEIRSRGLASLHDELSEVDPDAARRIHPNDEKRIVRALEVYRTSGTPISELQRQWNDQPDRYDCVRIGLRRPKDEQNRRINARAKKMMDLGLVEEVRALLGDPRGLSPQAAQAVGYAELIDHFQGKCTVEEAFERIKINTRRLAKKQRTWMRRWQDVTWFDVAEEETAEGLADRIMSEVEFS
ncbi:MAG: tRNA (adenosine(37)-N6)-dimethylallyltransferase MiaA [Phycisphaerae bacterium]